jgi:hypothetical protein
MPSHVSSLNLDQGTVAICQESSKGVIIYEFAERQKSVLLLNSVVKTILVVVLKAQKAQR